MRLVERLTLIVHRVAFAAILRPGPVLNEVPLR
jgi:hypothetical protein